MQKKISPIDPESIFAQDIGLRKFYEASQSSKLGRSEINSLFAAVGSRALRKIFDSRNETPLWALAELIDHFP